MDITKLQERHLLTERCKAIALEFCANLDQRRFDLMSEMFAADAHWRVNARQDRVVWGGTASASERAFFAGQFLSGLDSWTHTVVGIIGDGEKVVTKGITKASGPGTTRYNNTLSMHFEIDGKTGKIRDFTEFLDCYEVEEWIKTMDGSAPNAAETAEVQVDSVATGKTI